jgi:hypothetical protein
MKDVTCQSVCQQIDESDLQWQPDAIVSQHLRGCAACKKFYEEHVTLRKLVGSLGNVQAPAAFDFQLRSRLANERSQGSGKFVFRGWAVGFGPVAFASLVVIAGVIAFGVSRMQSHNQQMAPEISQGSNLNSQTAENIPSTERQGKEVTSPNDSQKVVVDNSPGVDRFRNVPNATRKSTSRSQIVSKDLGSIAAPVVKQDEQVANAGVVFPIEGSSQSLILSLDEGNGISRTISVPRVSFGSQRVLTGEQGPILKTSAKGVW